MRPQCPPLDGVTYQTSKREHTGASFIGVRSPGGPASRPGLSRYALRRYAYALRRSRLLPGRTSARKAPV